MNEPFCKKMYEEVKLKIHCSSSEIKLHIENSTIQTSDTGYVCSG